MVPSNIESKKGYKANNQGNWCNFVRPYILDPNSTAFTEISALYYKRLEELMGTSEYYSMDPFHEGANTDGIDVASAYSKIADAMYKANSNGKWVIQFWQWSGAQYNVLDKVEKGKLIVLDLFSDAHTHFNDYKGHDAVYCALPNFGGRTGLFGRLSKIMTDFFTQKSTYSNIKGIGATPEAIEQVPVLYDALFELPWRSSAPDPKAWLAAYSTSRYGTANANAEEAWEKMRNSALDCQTALQGPHEAVLCARPNLSVDKVSSWGGTEIFYDAQDVLDAAYKMLQAKGELSGENYSYDLTDFARQALTDYGYYLLKGINEAATSKNATAYATRRDAYLQLILDLDALLNTNSNFMLGRWTNMARNIADEANGTTESDKRWLELNNARTLITTWGENSNSEGAGLRDYSYREWGGMLKDFYYKRWKAFFDNRDNGTTLPNWFDNDWAWAHNASLSYNNQPTGNTADVATELFGKYFITVNPANASSRCFYRYMSTDLGTALNVSATRGAAYTFPTSLPCKAVGAMPTMGRPS
jgi:alpha-N-acetylglucosaminidase